MNRMLLALALDRGSQLEGGGGGSLAWHLNLAHEFSPCPQCRAEEMFLILSHTTPAPPQSLVFGLIFSI